MYARKHPLGLLTGFLGVVLCFLAFSGRSHGQSVSPTPEMLQIFQGLTPEQQDAILKQFTGGGSGSSGGGALGALGGVSMRRGAAAGDAAAATWLAAAPATTAATAALAATDWRRIGMGAGTITGS